MGAVLIEECFLLVMLGSVCDTGGEGIRYVPTRAVERRPEEASFCMMALGCSSAHSPVERLRKCVMPIFLYDLRMGLYLWSC